VKYKVGDYIRYKISAHHIDFYNDFEVISTPVNKLGEIRLEVIPAMLNFVNYQTHNTTINLNGGQEKAYYLITDLKGHKDLIGESLIKNKIEKENYLMEKLKAL
jgi:hypothetical protein